MSFVNLMADDDWSDQDIANRQRNVVAAVVSLERQDELRTIMIGHLANLRTATDDELAEVQLVKTTTEAAYADTLAARADMALLRQAWTVEAAQARLAQPALEEGDDGYDQDVQARAAAQSVVDAAAPEVLDLVAQRAQARGAL